MHFKWTSLAVIAAAALAGIDTVEASPAGFVSCMQNIKGSPTSKLVISSSNTYNTERFGFNLIFDYKPVAIYHPATAADAASAIKCAAANNINVAPRSGGHSFEGYCEGGKDGALVMDLSLMQQFSLDPTTGIASIGAGSKLGPLYAKLWNAGQYLIAAGTCPSVGIGGHTLGGGLGMVGRKYGMASDNVVGMTFVDPKGNILTVNASTNKDLFWALRGGGAGSYGLVTEFQIQAHKAPPQVTTMLLNFPISKYSEVIDAYAELGQQAPDELMAEMNVGKSGLQVQVNYLGPKTDAEAAVSNFLARTGGTKDQTVKEGTWYDAATQWGWLEGGTLENPIAGDNRYARGRSLVYRKPMSKKEKDILKKYLTKPPKGTSASYIIVDIWGGKVNKPNAPSAFDNHRGVLYGIEFISEWGDHLSKPGVKCSECLSWSQNFAKEMQKAYSSGPTLEAYQNYIERDMPNSMNAYYGSSLPRLIEIKKAVDPNNVFSYAQSIPLKSPQTLLVTPTSTLYPTDRLGALLEFDYKPAAIIHPGSVADAAAAIQCAAYWNVPVAPRSGGHSYEGYSEGGQDGALVIDLNLLQQFDLDSKTGVATVGAGMRIGPLYANLWQAGQYLIPAGTCPTVGVGGQALGGGLGFLSRRYGILVHSIVGLTMIDATGNIRRVSASSDRDLFWALRGAGGGSFGLVTEFQFRVYKAPPKVTTLTIRFARNTYKSVLASLATWARVLSRDLTAITYMDRNTIDVKINFLGSKEQALMAAQPILRLRNSTGPPVSLGDLDIAEGSWYDAATHWSGHPLEDPDVNAGRSYIKGRSLVYRQSLTDREMEIIDQFVTSPPNVITYAFFELWGGNCDRPTHVAPSAFDNHHGVLFGIQYVSGWSDPNLTPGVTCAQCLEWSNRTAQALDAAYGAGPAHLEAYQNYIDRDLPNALHVYYGKGLPRLKRIKREVDPRNVFRFPQSIPLSRESGQHCGQ
ncbi:hypothetical protein DFQ27_009832 [Actinomortierella ambigua]|uniref:FAD-binding PCMH-type domain-containing protein n=1 Tax=Actinomortierella ambigua TaxID=1343610 RepID=A0A9P6QGX7_9FUNG|nr:hypothetical protein DFQ27_009832 [Actinomortierella ambigua]